MRSRSEMMPPADAGPVERQVRPGAGARPQVEPVTLADVLDALNLFNRPKPSEDDGPWEGGHFIRVDHLPDFINIIAAAWFAPEAVRAAERERIAVWLEGQGQPGYAHGIRFWD